MNAIDTQQLTDLSAALFTDAEIRGIITALSDTDTHLNMVGLIDKLMTQRRLVPALMRAYAKAAESDAPGAPVALSEDITITNEINHIAIKLDAVYQTQFPERQADQPSTPWWFVAAARFLREGNRIQAIKDLRGRLFLGLKEAKTLVDLAHPGPYTPRS